MRKNQIITLVVLLLGTLLTNSVNAQNEKQEPWFRTPEKNLFTNYFAVGVGEFRKEPETGLHLMGFDHMPVLTLESFEPKTPSMVRFKLSTRGKGVSAPPADPSSTITIGKTEYILNENVRASFQMDYYTNGHTAGGSSMSIFRLNLSRQGAGYEAFTVTPSGLTLNGMHIDGRPFELMSVNGDGHVKANSFEGDGSRLTNIQSAWEESSGSIRYNGNVGIGTNATGSGAKLYVDGTAIISETLALDHLMGQSASISEDLTVGGKITANTVRFEHFDGMLNLSGDEALSSSAGNLQIEKNIYITGGSPSIIHKNTTEDRIYITNKNSNDNWDWANPFYFDLDDNYSKMPRMIIGDNNIDPSEALLTVGGTIKSGKMIVDRTTGIPSIKAGDEGNGNGHVMIEGHSSGNPRANTVRLNNYTNGDVVLVNGGGNVGIGTTNADCKLTVKGKIKAEEIVVVADVPKSDYVFEEEYKLRTLEEVEQFVKTNKHLPEVPSATEFKENGYSIGEMDDILLRKVEELTLYMIAQEKRIQKLEEENDKLRGE
jgi:hypothetical protein